MAVSAQAALLDELMGRNRNIDIGAKAKEPHWSDEDVCKYYLISFCPHDLFVNTKTDLGPCTGVHDDKLKEAYQKSKRFGKMGYETEFIRILNKLVCDVDKRIKRGHDRLSISKSYDDNHGKIDIVKKDKIDALKKRINDLLSQAESLGSEGNVDQAQGVLKICEQLKVEKANLEGESKSMIGQGKELEVCEICGAFRIKDDAPQRVEEHLAGKMHIGYAKIRDYLREFSEKRSVYRDYSSSERDFTRDRKHSESRSRHRTRSRSREERSKKHHRDRSPRDEEKRKKSHKSSSSKSHSKSSKRQVSPFSSHRRLPEGADL